MQINNLGSTNPSLWQKIDFRSSIKSYTLCKKTCVHGSKKFDFFCGFHYLKVLKVYEEKEYHRIVWCNFFGSGRIRFGPRPCLQIPIHHDSNANRFLDSRLNSPWGLGEWWPVHLGTGALVYPKMNTNSRTQIFNDGTGTDTFCFHLH